MIEKFWDIHQKKPSQALKNLLLRSGIKEIPSSLPETLQVAQKAFLRPHHVERWELHDKWKYFFYKKRFLQDFQSLGLTDEIPPLFKSYESLLILGGSTSDFIARLQFALSLPIHIKSVYLLSGERPLTKDEYRILYTYKNTALPKTEDQMMDFLFKRLVPKEMSYRAVVCPMHANDRPTTKDTIEAWLQTNPNKGHHLLISNQPFGYYQLLASNAILKKQRHDIQFDLAACRFDKTALPISAGLDTIARILYEINEKVSRGGPHRHPQ